MNFKLKSGTTNLSSVKTYKNTLLDKINYKYKGNPKEIYNEDNLVQKSLANALASKNIENVIDKTISQIEQKLEEINAQKNDTKISIPEGMGGGGYTVTVYQDQSWAYDQKKVYDLWSQAGSNYDNEIATYDNRYLIACTTTYGNVGDKVDFYLDDGTKIPCVIADIKSQEVVPWDTNPANEWGHNDGKNVIEFEVLGETFREYGDNPGLNGWFNEWGGKRVVSATNLGENIIKM